jgi:hypothetical protein
MIASIIILGCVVFGFFILLKPAVAIELQRRFYEKINWKIEPVSMPREIRNTKIMGLFVLFFCIIAAVFYFFLT